jgi:hypothetical protein
VLATIAVAESENEAPAIANWVRAIMTRTIVIYLVLALLFALLLLWLLVRFLSCCCSPIDAAFCQFGIGF